MWVRKLVASDNIRTAIYKASCNCNWILITQLKQFVQSLTISQQLLYQPIVSSDQLVQLHKQPQPNILKYRLYMHDYIILYTNTFVFALRVVI